MRLTHNHNHSTHTILERRSSDAFAYAFPEHLHQHPHFPLQYVTWSVMYPMIMTIPDKMYIQAHSGSEYVMHENVNFWFLGLFLLLHS